MADQALPVRVLMVGLGSVNRATLALALRRPALEVVGVVVSDPSHEGVEVRRYVESAPEGLRMTTSLAAALVETRPDVALVATRTRLTDVLPTLEVLTSAHVAAVCTAEELAFVVRGDSAEASRLYDLAANHRVAIIATGVNPGFVLDYWPLVATGLAWDVQRVRASRVVDVSVFGPLVRKSLGIGYEPREFEEGVRAGTIVGHAGFRESLRLLASRLGRPLDGVEIETRSLVLPQPTELPDGSTVPPGWVVGAEQVATGRVGGSAWLELALTLHVNPEAAGLATIDEVWVEGEHEIRARLEGGAQAIMSTAALLVNNIDNALTAPPGIHPPGSLPPPVPWLAGAEQRRGSLA